MMFSPFVPLREAAGPQDKCIQKSPVAKEGWYAWKFASPPRPEIAGDRQSLSCVPSAALSSIDAAVYCSWKRMGTQRNKKEVVIHCGKEYRFVVDYP